MFTISKDKINAYVSEYGYPVYIYDLNIIRKKIESVKNNFSNYNLLYSMKSNPHKKILELMLKNNVGIDAASKNEVLEAKEIGFAPNSIYYSAPGKSCVDIRETFPFCTVIADSLNELSKINAIGEENNTIISVGLRLNIINNPIQQSNFEIMGGKSSKFGIDIETLLKNVDIVSKYKYIRISGIHVYFGSQLMDEEIIANNFVIIAETFERLLKYFELEFVNFGGGFGIPYSDDEKELNLEKIKTLTEENSLLRECILPKFRCNLELGRFFVAESGLFITKVEDIKDSYGEKYVIFYGGMNSFFRPVFTRQNHKIIQYVIRDEREVVNITGNLCTPLDEYFHGIKMNKWETGDIMAFQNAGAYGYSMSMHDFIGFDKPAQIFIESKV